MRFPSFSWLIVFTLALCFSCSDETPEIIGGSFETPVVTGFVYRDAVGNPSSAAIGTPNNKTSSDGYSLTAYPNPSQGIIVIKIGRSHSGGGAPASGNSLTEVWLVPAILNSNSLALTGIPQNNNYFNSTYTQINAPLWATTLTNNDGFVRLTLEDITAGAYRLYAKVDGEILWENILILD